MKCLGFADDGYIPDEEIETLQCSNIHIAKPSRGLEFSFDLVEICGGSGVLSEEASKLGLIVCTPIDLSRSPYFNLVDEKLLYWILGMIKDKKFRAIVCEPPCTTFSPAQHPASRSYQNPLGFNRKDPKTLLRNILAFRCLTIMWFAWRYQAIALLKQPRLSKMAWLRFWHFLLSLGFEEAVIASCAFGSPHRKEFRLLGWSLDMERLAVGCPGGHTHVRIEGKFTKQSAVYVRPLAALIASVLRDALLRGNVDTQASVAGLESVVLNDLLLSTNWRVEQSWPWKYKSHINVLESHLFLSLLKSLVKTGGDCRFTALLDSRVVKGAHAKGRSSSYALKPTLQKACSYIVAGNPSVGFCTN